MKRLIVILAAGVAVSCVAAGAQLSSAVPRAVLDLPPGPGNTRNSEGDFALLKDGRILFAYSKFVGGTGGDHDQCVIAQRVSSDRGETWSGDRIVATNELEAGGNVMSVSFMRLKDGRLALFHDCKLKTPDGYSSSVKLMRTSSDEGDTWSAARDILPHAPKSYRVLNNARVLRLRSGRLLVPLADHGLFGKGRPFKSNATMVCALSDDDGETWRLSSPVGRKDENAERKILFQEPGVIELKDGRVMMYFRTNAGRQYYAYSTDGGLTWGAAEPSPLFSPLSPATIRRLATGELICFWNDHENRPDQAKSGPSWAAGLRTPLAVGISTDEGRTWPRRRLLESQCDLKHPQRYWYCYTAVLELEDRLLVAYCAEDNLQHLRITSIPRTWLPTADSAVADEAFVVAERGKPAACAIVLQKDPTSVQQYAASELQAFVERQTGVRLSVVGPGEACPARTVELTDGGAANPKEDGFRLKAEGSRLKIVAEPSRGGALYGVYELLERFGGCRWYASWCSTVPQLDRLAVPAGLDETHEPAFEMRLPFWYDALRHHDFAARLRMNSHQWNRMEARYGGERFRFGGGLGSCHTFAALVPVAQYGKTHPEYFAFRDGKRLNEVEEQRSQLCLSNPEVLEIVVSNVLARVRKDPGARFYGVSQNDNMSYCQCEKCAAIDAEEESHAGTVVRFVNAVAERVEKVFPEVTIETLAYQFSRRPPKKTRLRHNVIPCLCSIECDFARAIPESPCEENKAFCADIRGWRSMTDCLYVWDYTTDFAHYPLPFGNVCALQDNIRFFRDNGVRCLFEQGAYQGRHASFAELKTWLLAKWMWNPELPMKPLLDDFFAGYYGKGAPFVRAYFEELHRRQREWSADPKHPLKIFANTDLPSLPNEFLEEAAELFERAEAATKDDPVRNYNVRMSSFSVDYLRMSRLRGRGSPLLVFDPSWTNGTEIVQRQRLAASLLARMDEAKDIRLAEGLSRHDSCVQEWRDVLVEKSRLVGNGHGELEEKALSIARRGTWGDFVDDPQAADGKALKLFNTHYEWCTTLRMARFVFRPGRKYTLRVRLRVEPKEGASGEAVWAGVYDPVGKRNCGVGLTLKVSGVQAGYRWYDVQSWEPKPTDYLWIGPGRFNRKKGEPSSVEGVWIDKVEMVEL